MADTNGNTVSLNETNSGGIDTQTITDTIGRIYTFTTPNNLPLVSTFSYKDSNGNPQSVALSETNPAATPYPFEVSCTMNTPTGPAGTVDSCTADTGVGYGYISNASITLPAADGGSNQKKFAFDLDTQGRIIKITYPTGGYTRYDYGGFTVKSWSKLVNTFYGLQSVSHKYECTSTETSNCSEYTTTYAGTAAQDSSGNTTPYFSKMIVTDPVGNVATHIFSPITVFQIAPKETSVTYADSTGKLLSSQTTTYTPLPSLSIATDLSYPSQVTKNLYSGDGSTIAATSKVVNTYDTFSAQIDPFSYTPSGQSPQTVTVNIDNPTEIDEYDFGSVWKKTTVQTWKPASQFSGSGGHILDRMASKTVTDKIKSLSNSSVYFYDNCAATTTDNCADTVGNLTKTTVSATNASTASTQYMRNSYGQVTSIIDALGHQTTIGYADSWGNNTCQPASASSAYPTSFANALNQTKSYKYNSCTGSIASVSGPSTGQTTTYGYDPLNRVISELFPDGGQKNVCYYDAVPNQIATFMLLSGTGTGSITCPTSPATVAGYLTNSTTFDGFGRKTQSALLSDPNGVIYTDTVYDPDGRVGSQSNPYRSSSDDLLTTYQYDGLGRKIQETETDGSIQQWQYSGSSTTFFDELSNQWQRTYDAFGNVIQVFEPNGTTQSPTMETDYAYDGFNNLLSVNQLGNTSGSTPTPVKRSFTYDGLSRLLCASNPENSTATCSSGATSGVTLYSYDLDSNLKQKTTAFPNLASGSETTVYCYDALNRLTSRFIGISSTSCSSPDYSELSAFAYDGSRLSGSVAPSVSFVYPTGQMTDSEHYVGGTLVSENLPFNYDPLGRLRSEQQIPFAPANTTGYTLTHSYYPSGSRKSDTNNVTGIVFGYAYDRAARLNGVTSSLTASGSATYPSNLYSVQTYGPAGVVQATYAGDPNMTGFFNLYRVYDSRGRLTDNELYPSTSNFGTGSVAIIGGTSTASGSISITTGPYTTTAPYSVGATAASVANTMVDRLQPQYGESSVDETTSWVAPASYQALDSAGNVVCTQGFVPNSTTRCAVVMIKAAVIGFYGNITLSATPSSAYATTASNTTLIGGAGDPQGASTAYVATLTYQRNGNVASYYDAYNGAWNYTYDTLNRLASASYYPYEGTGEVEPTSPGATTTTTYNYQCWAYDGFGNRLYEYDTNTSGSCNATSTNYTHKVAVNANNQTTGVDGNSVAMDAVGNTVQDPNFNYIYDLEGRICAVQNQTTTAATQYVYDASGQRVAKGTLTGVSWPATGSTCPAPTTANGFTLTSTYLRGAGGSEDTEIVQPNSNAPGGSYHQNVYADGALLATYAGQSGSAPALYFSFNDVLGTKRVEMNQNGQAVAYWKSDPFGNYLTQTGSGTDATENHFTGKERDTESGNDYFGARYYGSSMGRFTSPDWSAQAEPVPYAKLDNPQSLNLYSYVLNNPLTGVDVDGHAILGPGPGSCAANAAGNGCSTGDNDQNQQFSPGQNPAPSGLKSVDNAISNASDVVGPFLVIPIAVTQLMEGMDGTPQQEIATDELEAGAGAIETEAETLESTVAKNIADANKLYPKLAKMKDQLHHITPKYLGGDPDGPLARIPAAYHQVITNAFRLAAPYGAKIERSAEEVQQILRDVYLRFPLP